MEKATFSLKMDSGTIMNNEHSQSSFQLNLRQILGERLFHRYKVFNLSLDNVQIGTRNLSSAAVTGNYKIATINLTSDTIDFMNSFVLSNGVFQKRALVGFLQFETYSLLPASQYFQNNSVAITSFTRPDSENADLMITLRLISDDSTWIYTPANYIIDDIVYTFSIYPIG